MKTHRVHHSRHRHDHPHATPAPSRHLPEHHVVTGDEDEVVRPITVDDIRFCAYRRWERAGRPAGDGVQFWLEAEQELGQGN
jgi:hypothetical protein